MKAICGIFFAKNPFIFYFIHFIIYISLAYVSYQLIQIDIAKALGI